MFSVSLFETAERLKEVIENMKEFNSLFSNRSEAIANAMLALRAIEEAEFRVIRSKQYIRGD